MSEGAGGPRSQNCASDPLGSRSGVPENLVHDKGHLSPLPLAAACLPLAAAGGKRSLVGNSSFKEIKCLLWKSFLDFLPLLPNFSYQGHQGFFLEPQPHPAIAHLKHLSACPGSRTRRGSSAWCKGPFRSDSRWDFTKPSCQNSAVRSRGPCQP